MTKEETHVNFQEIIEANDIHFRLKTLVQFIKNPLLIPC
jgi:hypothetical protein